MITTINNNQRKFYIAEYGWSSENYICNLIDIPKVLKEIADKEPYKIYEIANHKLIPLSKKKLNEILDANKLLFQKNGIQL